MPRQLIMRIGEAPPTALASMVFAPRTPLERLRQERDEERAGGHMTGVDGGAADGDGPFPRSDETAAHGGQQVVESDRGGLSLSVSDERRV